MSFGNASDVEQEKNLTDFRRNRSSTNSLVSSKNLGNPKMADILWNEKRNHKSDDSDSEISDSGNFLAKGMKSNTIIHAHAIVFSF